MPAAAAAAAAAATATAWCCNGTGGGGGGGSDGGGGGGGGGAISSRRCIWLPTVGASSGWLFARRHALHGRHWQPARWCTSPHLLRTARPPRPSGTAGMPREPGMPPRERPGLRPSPLDVRARFRGCGAGIAVPSSA